MLYGTGYWGVTEANYLVVAGHFLSALLGAKLWEGDYRSILGWQLPYGLSLRRGDLNLLLVLGGGLQQSFGCIYRTLVDKVSMSHTCSDAAQNSCPQRHALRCERLCAGMCTVLR